MQGKARQGKTIQGKARQDKTRQGTTRQDKTRQDKTRQDYPFLDGSSTRRRTSINDCLRVSGHDAPSRAATSRSELFTQLMKSFMARLPHVAMKSLMGNRGASLVTPFVQTLSGSYRNLNVCTSAALSPVELPYGGAVFILFRRIFYNL